MENMELLQAMRQMLSENNRQMMDEMNRQMSEEIHRQLSENNRQMMEEMRRQMAENNRQMMEEMRRQMAENNRQMSEEMRRQMSEEMHTQIQDAVAPIYSRLDSMDARLDKVESELQSVKTLATKTQLIVENEIDRKLNLLLEGHLDLCNRVAQLEKMNEVLEEMEDDVWNLNQIVARQILFGKPRSIRRKLN